MNRQWEEESVSLLEGLISHYSPSAKEQDAVSYLVAQMKKFGLDAFVDKAGNAIGRTGRGPKQILLLGHIDTVSGELACGNDGKEIFGRGACDAKAPLAAMVMAAAQLRGEGPNAEIIVAGAVEEEISSSKGAHFLRKALSPDYVIVGEPSNADGITIGYKGRLLATVRVDGEKGHSSKSGENAIERGIRTYHEMREALACGEGFDKISMKMVRANGGESGRENVDPAFFEFAIDCRVPPSIDANEIAAKLNSFSGNGIHVSIGEADNGVLSSENDPVARALVASVRANGRTPRYVKKLSSSDMNVVQGRLGTASYGPGDSRLDHTDNERVAIADYLASIEVLKSAIIAIGNRNEEARNIPDALDFF